MPTVFGIHPSQVRRTARELNEEASTVTAAAQVLASCVPAPSALPGGRTVSALAEGAGRISRAVDGEARVIEVLGIDLRSFADVVEFAEQDAVGSLSAPPTAPPAGVR